MDFKLITDENIPNSVIKQLRKNTFEIFSIRENNKGIDDEEISRLSRSTQAPILTMDKDFGYLTFHQKIHPFCIILIRIHPQSPDVIYSSILHLLNLYFPIYWNIVLSYCLVPYYL